jgi:hypothetical protein
LFVLLQLAPLAFEFLAQRQQFIFAGDRAVGGPAAAFVLFVPVLFNVCDRFGESGLGVGEGALEFLDVLMEAADRLGFFLQQRFIFLELSAAAAAAALGRVARGSFL